MPDDNVSNCTASPRHNSARVEGESTMADEHSHEHTESNDIKDRGKRSEGCSLLVRNLRYETSPARVRKLFERYGDVRDVYLPLDYYTRRPRGFGFVEFYEVADADKAARELDGHVLDGNDIHVVIAHDRRKSPETMRQLQRDGKPVGKFKPKGSFRHGGRDDRRERFDDRRERFDDRRERFDDRRERFDDRRERFDDRRERFDDRRERFDERYYDKEKIDVERRRRYDRSRSEERYRGFKGSEDRASSHSSYYRGRKPTRSNSRQRSRSSYSGSNSRYKNTRANEKSYSPRRPRSRSRSRSYSGNGK